jgi:hypothetical protein
MAMNQCENIDHVTFVPDTASHTSEDECKWYCTKRFIFLKQ